MKKQSDRILIGLVACIVLVACAFGFWGLVVVFTAIGEWIVGTDSGVVNFMVGEIAFLLLLVVLWGIGYIIDRILGG